MGAMSPSVQQAVAPPILAHSDKPAIPWMELGELDPKATLTPPPTLPAEITTADQRAANRFSVHGNAIITGGAGMLAIDTARALLEHGVSGLALLDLPTALKSGASAINALRAEFPSVTIMAESCDVTDAEGMVTVVQKIRDQLGPLATLCCFAGMAKCVSSADMDVNEWRRVLEVNTTGCWLSAQAVGKHMIADGNGGRIVFIASISGHRVNFPQPQLAYNVSKAGVLHMKNSLAAEWTRYGIRVNSVSPGYMDTVLNEGEQLSSFRKVWADRNPMRRMGAPQELTGPVVFLCSDFGGSYVNGADIVVDGGGIVF